MPVTSVFVGSDGGGCDTGEGDFDISDCDVLLAGIWESVAHDDIRECGGHYRLDGVFHEHDAQVLLLQILILADARSIALGACALFAQVLADDYPSCEY